jgi:hypothetical protein
LPPIPIEEKMRGLEELMNLTTEQKKAIDHGEAVPFTVEGRECVLMSREVYDRVKQVLDLDPRETYPAAIKAWDAYGSPLDATLYQDVEPE